MLPAVYKLDAIAAIFLIMPILQYDSNQWHDKLPPISKTVPKQLHVTSRPATIKAAQLSLIIPNASTPGPPTSSAVLVNLGKFSLVTKNSLLTKLETRLQRLCATEDFFNAAIDKRKIKNYMWAAVKPLIIYPIQADSETTDPVPSAQANKWVCRWP
jgi:hypothetical protein